ncbi:asparagine synthase-related protein [Sphingomonas sp. LB-2]|uniref:asparagine synthase n=1 Tax=Sphingomonas caeni TaxID=2984949 RepID=UPI00222FFBD9|nr:asparagine synthase-related protein [Sphingomonas caeni]MCW3846664.1 asparagine synthase-related protein [Sphingomonas caeni]
MTVFAFALALEPGRPLDRFDTHPLRPGLAEPGTLHMRSGLGWHAAWRNAPTGLQTDFAAEADDLVAITAGRFERRGALCLDLGVAPGARDAVLLIAAYRRWGEAMLDRLRGDFAFLLWDARQRRLIAARDQLGCSPLFYREHDGVLLVGTALDALRDHDRAGLSLDENFIGDLLLQGMPAQHETSVYAEIRRVPPARALRFAGGQVETRRYWSFPAYGDPLILTSRADYAERFHAGLRDAVAERLPETGPVVILMSGGLDSTAVAAVAAEILGPEGARARIKAYTTVFPGFPEQEGHYAALAAQHLGIEHHLVEAGDYLGAPLPDHDAWLRPEPGAIAGLLAESRAAEAAAAGGGVLLNGLGADVYLHPPGASFWHIAARGARALPDTTRHVRLFGRMPDLRVRASLGRLRRRLAAKPAPKLPAWIDAGFAAHSGLIARTAARYAENREAGAARLTSPYWAALLTMGHPATTGRSLHPAHPLASLPLIELAMRLPRAAVTDKAILRWAMRGRLPDAIVDRAKTPLGSIGTDLIERDPRIAARTRSLIEGQAGALSRFVDPALAIDALGHAQGRDRVALMNLELLAAWFASGAVQS